MSLQLSEDLNDVLTKFYEHTKEHSMMKTKLRENEKFIALLKQEVSEARKSEKHASSSLKRSQENVIKLNEITLNLSSVKDENEKLRKEISNLEFLLEKEKESFLVCEQKWTKEKESILENNKEEFENMKKIRNMEAASLNREMNRQQDENLKKIELLKLGLEKMENEHNHRLSQTVADYEEKILKLNRDLIAANNEVKNLRQLASNEMIPYKIDLGQPKSQKSIPQPMSFTRYRPLPIVSTASELYQSENSFNEIISEKNTKSEAKKLFSIKKKRLYNRADDTLSY